MNLSVSTYTRMDYSHLVRPFSDYVVLLDKRPGSVTSPGDSLCCIYIYVRISTK